MSDNTPLVVDYVLLDGQRYALAHNEFTRSYVALELPQLEGRRVQPPFVDVEVPSFEDGIKEGETLTASQATHVESAVGLDLQNGALRVGRVLEASMDSSGNGPIAPLVSWGSYLYAGELGSTNLYRFDGSSWALAATL
jgi:hypothetical protein